MSENLETNVFAFPDAQARALRRAAIRFPGAVSEALTPQDPPIVPPKDMSAQERDRILNTILSGDTTTIIDEPEPLVHKAAEVADAGEREIASALGWASAERGILVAFVNTAQGVHLSVWEPNK